ncbi:hypothetical protein ACRHK7_01920 [Weissella tructae]|uniref:Uncharacterized protein n=2 Tax=Weissella TaxID=46255 RepID=A0A075U751_9LACO|nr:MULTISPECIES: hypothetical protein [Weissella]AIG65927.1 hypothetical protein WS08_0988 [Weissella tructae]AIM63305.1 hypothetical protein WS74_1054 [Weissella ceti]AIM64640.1 hypothetical protein WS105_1050 [Weissella ceti]ELA07298.1 hypothetical protein WCNC_02537 [Weissella ceti NC36]QVV91085.1 hypothetical protein KHQ32_05535 [Weissella tructae]
MTDRLQDRLIQYEDSIDADLALINHFNTAARDLTVKHQPEELQTLAEFLTQTKLETVWVTVPRQYSHADWYLVALSRFMSLAGIEGYDMILPEAHEEMHLTFPGFGATAAFAFVPNEGERGGTAFTEVRTGLRLFYWSLERREIKFNAHALADLLIDKLGDAKDRTIFTKMLLDWARYMEETLGYAVDYNVLETANEYVYGVMQTENTAAVLDNLFVQSAATPYVLQRVGNEAVMVLADNVELRLFQTGEEKLWSIQVLDGEDAVSIMDLFLENDFLAAWYMGQRQEFELAYDEELFAEQTGLGHDISRLFSVAQNPSVAEVMPEVEADKVVVEILHPKKD